MKTIVKSCFSQSKLEQKDLLAHAKPKSVRQPLLDSQWKILIQAGYDSLQ